MKEAIRNLDRAIHDIRAASDVEIKWRNELKQMVKERFDTVTTTPDENEFLMQLLRMFD